MALFAPAAIGQGQSRVPDEAASSLEETERLAKQDLARRLRVPEGELTVLGSAPRTWRDRSLGCGGRKGLEEPQPVPGYEVVLGHAQKRYTYRADRQGNLRRCDTPAKPLGPISR